MKNKRDIESRDDVELLVNSFYKCVQMDEILGPIFNPVLEGRWEAHLEKMYRFWETVLLDNHTYYGSPFQPHAKLPVSKHHFDRWVEIFKNTVDSHFKGEVAENAKWRGDRMAEMFLHKIQYVRNVNTI